MGLCRIALLQMTACGNDQAANLAKGEIFCRRAADLGAEIALFPEMWNIGHTREGLKPRNIGDLLWAPEGYDRGVKPYQYTVQELEARAKWQAQSIRSDSPFIVHFQRLAEELRMAIALTYLEQWNGPPRNSMSLIDRHGEIQMTYAKVHTRDFDEPDGSCTPGDDFSVCSLNIGHEEVKIGAMICYDREFPESARILMLNGAEIILSPNGCTLDEPRLSQSSVHAYENMVGIAITNYAAPQNNGHSVAFSPVAYDPEGKPRDMLVVQGAESEGIYLGSFDLQEMRNYRQRATSGKPLRRPHSYGLLTSTELQKPSMRVNTTGDTDDRTKR